MPNAFVNKPAGDDLITALENELDGPGCCKNFARLLLLAAHGPRAR